MSSGKFRILVVDDDRDILELVQMTLGSDYDILTLSGSADAMDVAEFFEPDVVILDIMLPKVTGYELLEKIRKHPRLSHSIAIFLSAKDTSYDIKYGYKLGANLYLTKPFQPERLAKNIQMLIAQAFGTVPMKKTFSMTDVALRMKIKIGHYVVPGLGESEAVHMVRGRAVTHHKENDTDPDEEDTDRSKRWVN